MFADTIKLMSILNITKCCSNTQSNTAPYNYMIIFQTVGRKEIFLYNFKTNMQNYFWSMTITNQLP